METLEICDLLGIYQCLLPAHHHVDPERVTYIHHADKYATPEQMRGVMPKGRPTLADQCERTRILVEYLKRNPQSYSLEIAQDEYIQGALKLPHGKKEAQTSILNSLKYAQRKGFVTCGKIKPGKFEPYVWDAV